MSKVIMGNGGFTVALLNLKVFQRGERKRHKHVFMVNNHLPKNNQCVKN